MNATHVARLGRYEVLGELATGGMAEVLLARIMGPSGFERPVVVKRILPHLAKQPEFVRMFLDEARIAAKIRHPNVVQVQELAEEASELFLVMEYLEGESVSGVQKRFASRGEAFPPGHAAFVIAEACSGLHAAHEHGVVHRDVSPQNVFITYDGHVKLLDFGVALAESRVARTETGHVKGKFSYMSPEQWKSERLDRRSDVFAMGIVLYELSTGRRLFARDNPGAVMRAICDEPVLPPTRLMPDYPAALEAICLRALAADRNERYASAAELRRDLLAFVRTTAGEIGDPTEQLAVLMRQAFDDRIAEKAKMLREVREAAAHVEVVAGEADDAVELPSVVAPSGDASPSASAPVGREQSGRPRRSVAAFAFVATALVAAGTLTAVRSRLGGGELPTSAAPPPSANAREADRRDGVVSPPSASIEAKSAEVTLRIESRPPGAHVRFRGADAGITPLEIAVAPKAERELVELSLRGHQRLSQELVADRDQSLFLTLERETSKRPPGKRGPGPSASPAPSAETGPRFGRFE